METGLVASGTAELETGPVAAGTVVLT
jgi:hypothetical protein